MARDTDLAYPINGHGIGLGPLKGQTIQVAELDSEHGIFVESHDGTIKLFCTSSGIEIVRDRTD